MKKLIVIFTVMVIGCSNTQISNKYSKAQMDYFFEIALGAEFGDSVPVIKKWDDDIHIKIHGEPTEDDINSIKKIVNELNDLLGVVNVRIVDENENVSITFSPESEFASLDPNYVPTNYGFFWALWHDDNYVIYEASILISSVEITQMERSHLIREELTQSLGLMNDSDAFDNSIFYHKWTDVTNYSDIDRAVIELLYHKQIKPGMTKSQVAEILS
jgi:hypothetical protein